MTPTRDRETAGGVALAAGFLLVAAVLYRNPADGLAAATATASAVVYFLALPATGLLAGAYVVAGGRYAAPLLIAFGSYLGVFGVGVALWSLLTADSPLVLSAVGATVAALSVVALVAGARRLVGSLGVAVDTAWGARRPPDK